MIMMTAVCRAWQVPGEECESFVRQDLDAAIEAFERRKHGKRGGGKRGEPGH